MRWHVDHPTGSVSVLRRLDGVFLSYPGVCRFDRLSAGETSRSGRSQIRGSHGFCAAVTIPPRPVRGPTGQAEPQLATSTELSIGNQLQDVCGWWWETSCRIELRHRCRWDRRAASAWGRAARSADYFLVPNGPPRFSGRANPGGGVVGSWAGGFGVGGFEVVVAMSLRLSRDADGPADHFRCQEGAARSEPGG